MKWIWRGMIAALVLAGIAIGVLAWALPRLARSEAARARIEAVARAALGRELRYGEIDFGLFPPSLHVVEPSLAGAAAGDPLLARADSVALRVELGPLLRRQLEVSSLVVEGLALHLVRTADGLVLPRPAGGEERDEPSAPEPASPEDEGIGFGIRKIAVRDGALTLEDRSETPAVVWRAEAIDLRATSAAADEPIAIEGSLRLASDGALAIDGPLSLDATLENAASGATGPFRIDASDARVAYGVDFTKPAGTQAVLRGRLVNDAPGALGADDLELVLHNLVMRGELRTAPRTALRLRAEAFALDGWEKLVPPLALAPLRGRVAIPELALTLDPLSARGKLNLDDLVASPPGRAPLALQGGVELLGTDLRTHELVVRAADQPIRLAASVRQLFTAPRYEVAFETAGADTNALLAGYAGKPDRLLGPLNAKGTLRGTVSGATSLAEALGGNVEFGIEKGRIVGASLLEAVLGSLGARLAEAGRGRGGRDWERFYSDEFESLGGRLRIAEGRILSEPVTLRYRDYAAELQGAIQLSDLALDLRGSLTWYETLDAELARAFGARSDYVPQTRTLDLAAVRGTLDAPKVQIASSSITSLAAAYATGIDREELKRKVEKELGEGSGEIVDQGLEVLEGLLGGGKK